MTMTSTIAIVRNVEEEVCVASHESNRNWFDYIRTFISRESDRFYAFGTEQVLEITANGA